MADLIAPHGGELVNRTVSPNEAAEFRNSVPCTAAIAVSDADLSTLYRIADGGLSPLTGPMTKAQYLQVLEEEVVVKNGKKYAWTIPLAFPATDDEAEALKPGSPATLVNEAGDVVGRLDVKDVYPWDKAKYNRVVYQTDRTDHPGARIALSDPRTFLVGGEVKVLPQPIWPSDFD